MPYIIITIILLIAALLLRSQFEKLTLRHYTVLSMFTATAVALRIALAFIPSAKPTSYIIIMAGILMGPAAGFMTGLAVTLLSSFSLGFGPYVFYQAISWGIMGLIGAFFKNSNRWVVAIYGFVWGYIFGWITNLWWLFSGTTIVNFSTILAGNISSFPHDTLHAVANFVLLAILPKSVIDPFMNKYITKK